ncbi:MAG: cupin domain-containing protein [Gemmatimonadetes bacterium]|nr:cupin domain-containing protein [Gemmatimonadota bacterium]
MSVKTVNLASIEHETESRGVRFEVRRGALSERLDAEKLRYGTLILPPGKADGPYRFHLVAEAMVFVLGGECWIRLGGPEHALTAGDVVALPPRASSAWQLVNRGSSPAHLFVAETVEDRDVIGHPDSEKRIYRMRSGGEGGESVDDLVLSGDRIVDVWEGETVDEPLGEAPEAAAAADPRISSIRDVAWEAFGGTLFHGERKRLSRAAGGERLGYSLYRLKPGERPYPFHFHHVNEEAFFVRTGYGELRTLEGTRKLSPGDAFGCPPGIVGAHGLLNTGDGALEYFAVSTMIEPEVIEYPDSDKLYAMVGAPPGGDPKRRVIDRIFRRSDAVEYEEGER